ncbi:hypothetical protein AWZ03_004604 [Drosophila navojoa]|uniref:Calponin-homology (CH) domain-containing protein n=1 Tax=Drosophila navojoa TaxID=7232 RepID=A0A484BLL0_DRONA|nr:hypothetical protein AWZ03_004604 [Drosophila navojoa]
MLKNSPHLETEAEEEDYLSILNLSSEEAIRDLKLICDSIWLLKAQIASRRASLAREQELAESSRADRADGTDSSYEELSKSKDREDGSDTDTLLYYSDIGSVSAFEMEEVELELSTSMSSSAMSKFQLPLDSKDHLKLELKSSTTSTPTSSQLKRSSSICTLDGKTFGDRHRELLVICQKIMRPYGIPMYEFSTSWTSGHAFCAFIHSYRPDLIDSKYLKCESSIETLRYVEQVGKTLGARFDGNFVKYLRRKRPGFVKIYYYVAQLYNSLESMEKPSESTD